MSAILQILDTDESTVLTSINEGNIETPETTTAVKRFVKNNGDETAEETEIELVTVGTNDGVDYAYLAEDLGGTPGSFQQTPVSLGTISAGSTVAFWMRESVPAGRTADNNVRRFDLRAACLTV
jgi:hypothetical protein